MEIWIDKTKIELVIFHKFGTILKILFTNVSVCILFYTVLI